MAIVEYTGNRELWIFFTEISAEIRHDFFIFIAFFSKDNLFMETNKKHTIHYKTRPKKKSIAKQED